MTGDEFSRLHIVYDDRVPVPTPVREIIGAARFSGVLRRQRSLRASITQAIRSAVPDAGFTSLSSDAEALDFVESLGTMPTDRMILRLPSMLVPSDMERFRQFLAKCIYAFEPLILDGMHDGEAATLTSVEAACVLIRLTDGDARRSLLSGIAATAGAVDEITFLDLRDISSFLHYMTSATETRHFNSMSTREGIFCKRSPNIAKMRAEHDFFHIAPAPMKRFLLPTFDYLEEENEASYAMEHCVVPDAALQFVHGAFTPKSFAALLDHFFRYLDARPSREVTATRWQSEATAITWGKVEARIADMHGTEEGRKLEAVLTSCGPMGGLADICARAEPLVRKAVETDTDTALRFSHRDPCLSNILFDRRISFFRLIDPHGATDPDDAMTPALYDIAKMSHSVIGGYDFINNGRFDTPLDDGMTLALHLDDGGPPDWAKVQFRARLADRGIDWRQVRAYELSLFLSMLPLHRDFPRKLPAFVLTATKIIEELEAAG